MEGTMSNEHVYTGRLDWTGSAVQDAQGALHLPRKYLLEFEGVAPLEGSSPPVYRGEADKHNPETLLVSALMACHHLTYLALCEKRRIGLLSYSDTAVGKLAVRDGKMRFVDVLLQPVVRVADAANVEQALKLHERAHEQCFIANSMNFTVRVAPQVSA
jgi:organic hydroperoxide reductase OsmC/OhrA